MYTGQCKRDKSHARSPILDYVPAPSPKTTTRGLNRHRDVGTLYYGEMTFGSRQRLTTMYIIYTNVRLGRIKYLNRHEYCLPAAPAPSPRCVRSYNNIGHVILVLRVYGRSFFIYLFIYLLMYLYSNYIGTW